MGKAGGEGERIAELSPRCVSVSYILPGLLCVTGKVIEPVRGDRVLWNLHTKPMEPYHREFFPGL